MPTRECKKMRHSFTISLISIGLIFSFPVLAQEKISSPADRCSQAKKNYVATEQEWASVNAEVGLMRGEIERLRDLRWEIKTTLSILSEALKIVKEKGNLNETQRASFNSRIPDQRGMVNPDDTFTMSGLETGPVKLIEANGMFSRLLAWSEENIKKTETDLKEKEKKSHLLSRRLAEFEGLVEKECKAAGAPTPWEQGQPRVSEDNIYQRYVEREKMRQQEVESRQLADLDRLWLKRAYPPHGHYPYHLGYGSKAMLIELINVNKVTTCLRCYPFGSPLQERQILNELDRAATKHEKLPCVGLLGEYRIIQIYNDPTQCYSRVTR